MDDPDPGAGDSAGPAAAGAARRRALRHLRSQRPLPAGHQPQQPPEAADRAARARHHHPQREADAAGGGRRAVRQRPPRPRHHRRQQAAAEVARRHAQGQAGPLPAEPARQARRLFRPLGDRGRSRAQAPPVRAAEEDGARAVQAVHLFAARRQGPVDHGQAGEEAGREGEARGLGHPRRGHSRAPGAAQPRPDLAPPRHPGVRAGADRGQGDPAASAGLRGLQRRLRRRPDGRARAAVARSAARGARADDEHEQHPASGERLADHRAVAGHRARPLLPLDHARGSAPEESEGVRRHGRDRARAARAGDRSPHQDQISLDRRGREGQAGAAVVRHHARPGDARPGAAEEHEDFLRRRQQADDQAGNLQHDRSGLPPLRAEGDGDLLRPDHGARLPPRLQGRHLVRQGRHGGPQHEVEDHRADPHARQGVRAAIQRRSDHPGREVQQGGRRLVEVHRADRRRNDAPDLVGGEDRGGPRGAGQLDLHDGAFRRARLARADAPARRHARPDGQAVGRDHRDPDHLELQGRALGARVLQLDPRRPQRPRRHRAQDRQLGLSHPPAGRRGAGLHHHHRGLRDLGRHQDARHHRRRPGRSLARRAASSDAPRPRTCATRHRTRWS